MNFELTYTAEQESFRKEVREWLELHVPADINRRPRSTDDSWDLYRQRRALGRLLGARGWLYPWAPKEYGGGGYGIDSIIVLEEESERMGLTLPPYYDTGGKLGGATILEWGTPEQKQRFLPPIFTGEVRTWQLLSEPGAGSDLAGVATTAVRDGDAYRLNGQKIYVGSEHGADRAWVIAVTDPKGERHKNLSWFMIDFDLPGISSQPQELLSCHGEGGDDRGHKNTVYFDDVIVPADALIGGENNGWRVAATHLELEHGAWGSIRRSEMWERLLGYCRAEIRDGRRLIENPDVQMQLGEIFTRLETVRLLGIRNFWKARERYSMTYEGSQLDYVRKTTGLWLTKAVLDIIGTAALTDDETIGAMEGFAEAQQREGIVGMHPGGTTDIQRVIIARRLGVGVTERKAG